MNKIFSKILSTITAGAVTIFVSSGSLQTVVNEIRANAAENEVIYGDLNNDGNIDSFDAVKLRNIISNGKEYIKAADLDGNGQLNYYDLFLINQFLLGEPTYFSAATFNEVIAIDRSVIGEKQDEVSLTVEMANMANTLSTPINIYNYVINDCYNEFYPNSRKGAIGTFEQHGGNDYDISSLFIAMVRYLNYDASYVSGEITINIEQALNYTGADDVESALKIIQMRDPEAVYNETNSIVSFKHIWVKLIYDGKEYFLDPSFKEYETVNSLFDDFQYDENIEPIVEDIDYFNSNLTNNNIALSDNKPCYLTKHRIKFKEYSQFPTELQYSFANILEYSKIPSEQFDMVSIFLDGKYHSFTSVELYNKKISIEYAVDEDENEGYDINPNNVYGLIKSGWSGSLALHPYLKIDNEVICEGTGALVGSVQRTAVKIYTNGQEHIFTKDMCVGSIYTLIFDYQNIAAYRTTTAINNVNSLNSSINKNNLYSDEYLGKILELIGYNYFSQLDIYSHTIAEETNIYYSHNLSVAFFGYEPEITEKTVRGVLVGHYIEQSGDFVIDIIGNTYNCAVKNKETINDELFKSSVTMMSSYLESSVLNDLFDVTSVSTIEVINHAKKNNVDIDIIYNGSEIGIDDLDININAKNYISEALNNGYIITVPQRDITINNWTGSGYIVFDPNTGNSIYMLSRNVTTSGGATTTGISFDQILAATASSLNLAISASVFYNLINAYTMASMFTPVPGLGVVALATFCFVSAVFNYVFTLAIASAACNGDSSCQEYLREQRIWNIVDIGLTVGLSALFKIGNVAKSNYYKNRVPKTANNVPIEENAKISEDLFVSINKETATFTEYTNFAGNSVRISKTNTGALAGNIERAAASSSAGTATEGKVAKHLVEKGIEVLEFGNKVKSKTGQDFGNIDIGTGKQLIEAKVSISSVDVEQFEKYINPYSDKFFNFNQREVILYIDEIIDVNNSKNAIKLSELKELESQGVIVVNGLDELDKVIK